MLAEAAKVFIASGDHRLAGSAAALAGPAAPFPDLPELTSRESDVLSLVSRGMTNQQIADQLFLSPRTVEKHVERLRAKTGTANRTELAALALTSATERVRDASGR